MDEAISQVGQVSMVQTTFELRPRGGQAQMLAGSLIRVDVLPFTPTPRPKKVCETSLLAYRVHAKVVMLRPA